MPQPRRTLVIFFACAMGAIYLARKRALLREHIRPIYTRLGILPK